MEKIFNTGENKAKITFNFESISYVILFLTIFFLPFFFVPFGSVSFNFSKTFLLVFGILLSFLFWLIAKLKERNLKFPKSVVLLFALLVPLSYLASSIFSGSVRASFLGNGFEIDTFGTVSVLFLMFVLITLLFKSKQRLFKLYAWFFVSVVVVMLFQTLRLVFGPEFLSLGVFFNPISNLIGKWNDMAIFSGLAIVLLLSMLEFLNITKLMKVVSYIILLFSIFFLVIINFTTAWFVVGVFSLVLFVYSLMFKFKRQVDNISPTKNIATKKKFPLLPLLIFVLSVVFVVTGGLFTETISSTFGTSQIDARPSWQSTFEIAGESLKVNPILGIGPNRFYTEWLLHKPDGINSTIFWNTDFNSGISFVFSSLATVGVLGFLSWILFMAAFLFVSVKGVFNLKEDFLKKSIVISSFLASVYLWIFNVLYVPDIVLLSLSFVFSGVLMASLYNDEDIKKVNISFSKDSKIGTVVISSAVVFLVLTLLFGIFSTKKFISNIYFQKGVTAANVDGNIEISEKYIKMATNFDGNDLYYRTLAQIDMIKLNKISLQTDVKQEILQEQFRNTLGEAINNAKKAINIDGTNYQNWLSLGSIYEAIVPLKVEGSYESASGAYQESLKYNPENPAIYLALARLEIVNKNTKKARDYIKEALNKKNNYTEAFFLLSQLETDEGNIDAAISSMESVANLSPNDPTIFFYLGLLKYNNKNYSDAITNLERAVALSPSYSNAKYFLGLSYEKINRINDAKAQFEDIKTLNPGNKEIEQILTNLKNGKNALFGIETEKNITTDKKELPIKKSN